MKTSIQSPHFKIDAALNNFILDKIDKLDKLFNGIESCNVILQIENDTKNEDMTAEVSLTVPGKILIAKDRSAELKQAVDKAMHEVQRQLLAYKEKLHPYI